jgi:predicted Zn-dependent protease
MERGKGFSVMVTRFLVLVLACTLVVACDAARSVRDAALDTAVQFVPRSVDIHFGRSASAATVAKAQRLPDPVHSRLRNFVAPIAQSAQSAGGHESVAYRFFVLQQPTPNAFAFPDGSIFFTTGLIELSKTPEEILAVAGHEVAHVEARHGMQSMMTHMGLTLALHLFLGDLGVFAGLAGMGGQFMALQFSRDNEREADALGAEVLRRAGLPLRGISMFFERMSQWEQTQRMVSPDAALVQSFLSTHPATEERRQWAEDLTDDPSASVPASSVAQYHSLKKDVAQLTVSPPK